MTLTTNVCWAESSHSKLFLTPLITTEYYPPNPQCLNINQNDNIRTGQPCHTFKYTFEQPTYMQNLQFSSLKVIFILFSPCIVNDNSLLVPTYTHIILIYIYIILSGSYLFQLVTILREIRTKWLKTHSSELVLTTLCTRKCTEVGTHATHRTTRSLLLHFKLARHNTQTVTY